MTDLLTINVTNLDSNFQQFYFFQQPAVYSGGGNVYSNSLYSQSLGNYQATGAMLTFQVNTQSFASIQQANGMPTIGQASGYASATRAIDLTPPTGSANNGTIASIKPLGLSPVTATPGVQPGAFRITTPSYQPPETYIVGSAVNVDGGIVLSNFVIAYPNSLTDCQPVPTYYVQTGGYTAGTVMNFTQSSINAAICDFSGGASVINVTFNPDGTWSVQVVR